MAVLGWLLWGVTVYLAASFTYGIRKTARTGRSFQQATAVMAFLWWLLAFFFVFTSTSKLHLAWLLPIGFFGAQIFANGLIPILSSLVLRLTSLFVRIVLVGVDDSHLEPEAGSS